MLTSNKKIKSALLVAWTLLLTSLTFMLGAVPLNGLYHSMGRTIYWLFWVSLSVVLLIFKLVPLALGLLAISLVVGLYNEIKGHGYSYITAGFAAIFATTSTFFAGAYYWAAVNQFEWGSFFKEYIKDNVLKYLPPAGEKAAPLDLEQIVMQLPSAGVILLTVSLFLAIVLEERVLTWLQLPVAKTKKLREFKLPDVMIWIFISSLLMAFVKVDLGILNLVGINVLNVVVLFYYFQGIAVIATYFELTKMSPFWRSMIYIFATMQLFLAVALFGVMDYWMNFRLKMTNKMTEIKNL